ncbi:hypothetical protein ABEB36_002302 [Hypothenemus hampei]|uniref:BDBT FKBP like N-terminal domain-containing protein n=1 Tax=Hypothenemus hampei TaxID=57062 RepID=A0ABD1F5C1_HYPHA
MQEWTSPDDKIFKKILQPGDIGAPKPYEGSTVKLNIIECPPLLAPFNNKTLVLGENDGDLGRLLDICVNTMHLGERALFTVIVDLKEVVATIELCELQFNGFIYEWDAKKKYQMALKYKEKGAKWFAEKNNYEAAHWFTKSLKIISSIPIPVGMTEQDPQLEVIDEIPVRDIGKLKANLFNNLSSCYFKQQVYDLVIPLCQKVLAGDPNNVKALYKIGVAYESDKNFEKAYEALTKLLEIEPQNKACVEHLANINAHLQKAEIRVNEIMKKMFIGSIGK